MDRLQEVGNRNESDFTLACILCGAGCNLTLTAHRNGSGKVCGWLVACSMCQPHLVNFRLRTEDEDTKAASLVAKEIKEDLEAKFRYIDIDTKEPTGIHIHVWEEWQSFWGSI